MKKIYTTPMIAIERYELTQSIATCITKIGFISSECVQKDPDAPDEMKDYAWDGYFVDTTVCDNFISEDMDGADTICYHTSANAAFNS